MKTTTTKQFIVRVILTIVSIIIMVAILANKRVSAAEDNTGTKVTVRVNEEGKRELVLEDGVIDEDSLTKTYVNMTPFNGYEKMREGILNLFNLTPADVRYRYVNFTDDIEILNGLFKEWIPYLDPAIYTDTEKNDMINLHGFMGYVFNTLCRMQENGLEIYITK